MDGGWLGVWPVEGGARVFFDFLFLLGPARKLCVCVTQENPFLYFSFNRKVARRRATNDEKSKKNTQRGRPRQRTTLFLFSDAPAPSPGPHTRASAPLARSSSLADAAGGRQLAKLFGFHGARPCFPNAIGRVVVVVVTVGAFLSPPATRTTSQACRGNATHPPDAQKARPKGVAPSHAPRAPLR